MVIICVLFWFFVVVVVGVFHLERVSLLCINFEQPLVTRGKSIESFCFVKKVLANIGVAPQKEED